MTNPPKINHLSDISPATKAAHTSAFAQLDLSTNADKACKECPKPVWFTAFFDGTGNNYTDDGAGSDNIMTYSSSRPSTPGDKGVTITFPGVKYSNIAKLAHFSHTENSNSRIAYQYIEGVGTKCMKSGVNDTGEGSDGPLGNGFANKGEARIDWMLTQLDKHASKFMPYVNQINIAVFGFSRGVAQARAFVRMLTKKLAIDSGEDELYWAKAGLDGKHPKVVVYFMGLFDTVASVGFGGSRLESIAPAILSATARIVPIPGSAIIGEIAGGVLRSMDKGGHAEWAHDLRIPKHVLKCVHFVAAHEVREKFPSDSVRQDQVLPANCIETFYPGAHSDVGGGYAYNYQEGRSNQLANVALNNMYINAYKAGVPLKSPDAIMKSSHSVHFEISSDLENCWNTYLHLNGVEATDPPPTSRNLEKQIIWHMNRYYEWRASRRRRLAQKVFTPTGGVDKYMAITDRDWDDDVSNIRDDKSGLIRSNTAKHEDAIYNASYGNWIFAQHKVRTRLHCRL
jgi:hypothetical protein